MCASVSGRKEVRQLINTITNRLFTMATETETGPVYHAPMKERLQGCFITSDEFISTLAWQPFRDAYIVCQVPPCL